MPRFEPFPGLRFATELAGSIDDVSCPPYDVIGPRLRAELLARSPYNMVRLELPDGLGPPGTGDIGPAAARATLDAWRAAGVLRRDPSPSFYGYRTTAPAGDRPAQHSIGIVGALTLEPPGVGILPHEETTPGSRTGHSRLLPVLRVNVSPIWVLSPTTGLAGLAGAPPPLDVGSDPLPGVTGAEEGSSNGATGLAVARTLAHSTVAQDTAAQDTAAQDTAAQDTAAQDTAAQDTAARHQVAHVVAHALDEDGVLHELWPISDPERIDAIRALVGSQPLLLADGHHRYETALAYHEARLVGGHTDDAGSGALMAYVVELSPEQLHVQAIHRLITGISDPRRLFDALSPWFALEPTGRPDRTITARMTAAGAAAVVTRDGTWLAHPTAAGGSPAEDLDSRRLDTALSALAGITVNYQHGWEQVAAAVAGGQADAAVLLRPPSVRQIAEISRGGGRMPPKTSFFWPKPRSGLVLRELDA